MGEYRELVERIAARAEGARDAEADLCRRFALRAQLYGRRHLRDQDRARDLAQAVMLAVIEAVRAGRVEDPERLDRFVLGTCRNVASRMRADDARAPATDPATLDLYAGVAPNTELVDMGALYKCFRGLDPRGRTVVHLSFNEEKSAEEIAAIVETTAGNVRVLRHRAVAALRQCLDECGGAAR